MSEKETDSREEETPRASEVDRGVMPGTTFMGSINGKSIPMKVEKVINGIAVCKSLDLKFTARILVGRLERFINESKT